MAMIARNRRGTCIVSRTRRQLERKMFQSILPVGASSSGGGICIKEGTMFDGSNPGKHIGGLYIMGEDRKRAEDAAPAGSAPLYAPTFGSCPPGYFFLQKDLCARNVNRVDCDEIGKSVGFATGRTAEGKRIGLEKCAQAPVAGENVYIYEPRGRAFSANLRAITPSGS